MNMLAREGCLERVCAAADEGLHIGWCDLCLFPPELMTRRYLALNPGLDNVTAKLALRYVLKLDKVSQFSH